MNCRHEIPTGRTGTWNGGERAAGSGTARHEGNRSMQAYSINFYAGVTMKMDVLGRGERSGVQFGFILNEKEYYVTICLCSFLRNVTLRAYGPTEREIRGGKSGYVVGLLKDSDT